MTDHGKNEESEKSEIIANSEDRVLTRQEFQGLSDVPAELEWFANIDNANTKRAYVRDVKEFLKFTGIVEPREFRDVTRAHVIAWRKQLESRELAAASIRRKLSSLASLYDFLCERNAIEINPTHGVKRPSEGTYEGKTPALGDAEAKKLLEAPPEDTLKGLRDRAILATYLFHGLRASELSSLTPSSIQNREGVPHLRIVGKRSKIRFVPLHPQAQRLIFDYLEVAGHVHELKAPLPFREQQRQKKPVPYLVEPIFALRERHQEMGARSWSGHEHGFQPRDEGYGRHERSFT